MATPDPGPCSSTSSANSSQQPSSDNVIRLDDEVDDQSSEPQSSEPQSSSVTSVLTRLKSPTEADITRKRKTKTNPPPIGKHRSQGKSASDPKGIEPSKRVKEFPTEQLKVSGGKLFCSACREELGLKSSTVQNHIRSQKHENSKKKLALKEAREQDIAVALSKHNDNRAFAR